MPKDHKYREKAERFAKFCENTPRTVRQIQKFIGGQTAMHKLVGAAGSLGYAIYYNTGKDTYETWRR